MKATNANAEGAAGGLFWGRAAIATLLVTALATLLAASAVPCGFAAMTHHPCPGCGSTRAVLALARGDLGAVVRNNPFGPVMALVLGLLVVQTIASTLRHGDLRAVGGRGVTRVVIVLALFETALWIARFCGAFGGPVPV